MVVLPSGVAQSASEGVVVNEGQGNGVGTPLSKLQEQKLGLWGDLERPAAPLGSHPPQLAPRTGQKPPTSQLQKTQRMITRHRHRLNMEV